MIVSEYRPAVPEVVRGTSDVSLAFLCGLRYEASHTASDTTVAVASLTFKFHIKRSATYRMAWLGQAQDAKATSFLCAVCTSTDMTSHSLCFIKIFDSHHILLPKNI